MPSVDTMHLRLLAKNWRTLALTHNDTAAVAIRLMAAELEDECDVAEAMQVPLKALPRDWNGKVTP